MDLRDVVRSHTQTRSIYRADVTRTWWSEKSKPPKRPTPPGFLRRWDGKRDDTNEPGVVSL